MLCTNVPESVFVSADSWVACCSWVGIGLHNKDEIIRYMHSHDNLCCRSCSHYINFIWIHKVHLKINSLYIICIWCLKYSIYLVLQMGDEDYLNFYVVYLLLITGMIKSVWHVAFYVDNWFDEIYVLRHGWVLNSRNPCKIIFTVQSKPHCCFERNMTRKIL